MENDKNDNQDNNKNLINKNDENLEDNVNQFKKSLNNDNSKNNNSQIKEEKNEEKNENNIKNEDNENLKKNYENDKINYIINNNNKNSKEENPELMSETEILNMSLNKKEEKENEINEGNLDNKEKKEEIKDDTENVNNNDKKSNNDSDIIDNIIKNELKDIPKDEKIIKKENIYKNEQIEQNQKKYKTLKDLEKNPFKKIKIDSPRSLKVIYDNGYTLEELYSPLTDPYEKIYLKKEEQESRNDFYEQIRINKIKRLCEFRDKLIKEKLAEKQENKNIKTDENMKENDELIKDLILKTKERILDDNLKRIKSNNDIEIANIVQYELDKILSNLQLRKSADNFKKEKLKLKEFEILLHQKNKNLREKRFKEIENKQPLITDVKTLNENLISFNYGKRKNENDYNKQKLIQRLKKIELLNIKKNQKFKKKLYIEQQRAKYNLQKSEDKFNVRKETIQKKMEWKNMVSDMIKRIIKKDQLEKKEINFKNYIIKKEHINKLKKKEEIEKEKKFEILNHKGEQRKNIKILKERIYSSRKNKYNTLEKERKINISKVQKILKNGEGENEKNLDILIDEFPDNPIISEVIKNYQTKKNEINNNKSIRLYSSNGNLYNTNNSVAFRTINNDANRMNKSLDNKRIFIYSNKQKKNNKLFLKKNEKIKNEERRINSVNNINKQLKYKDEYDANLNDIHYEHELDEKIRKFKVEIYKNFLKKVKEEKNKEMMRKKQLELIDDIILKQNLEIQFSNERALIDLRLRKESENLKKITKEYEIKLKNNFRKKQDKILNLITGINEEIMEDKKKQNK